MNKKLEKISKQIMRHKASLQKEYSIKEIGIFGSYIRGEENKNSDLDILVDMDILALITKQYGPWQLKGCPD